MMEILHFFVKIRQKNYGQVVKATVHGHTTPAEWLWEGQRSAMGLKGGSIVEKET